MVFLWVALGADVKAVPRAPFSSPLNFNKLAQSYAAETPNAVWTDQFDNVDNQKAHYETTGPEIWEQTHGKVDCIVFATGTGGTLSGTGRFLKERNPNVKVFLADPEGSVLYNYFTTGELTRKGDGSITQGIGQGRITGNMQNAVVDKPFHITDRMAVEWTFRLLHEEGFFVGSSSGLNVAAAIEAAKELGPGHTIVTCLCDSGQRYFAELFSKSWLQNKNLLDAIPEAYRYSLFD